MRILWKRKTGTRSSRKGVREWGFGVVVVVVVVMVVVMVMVETTRLWQIVLA